MAGEVIVDALPYIDQGYDEPGIREAVSIHLLTITSGSLCCETKALFLTKCQVVPTVSSFLLMSG